MTWDSLSSLFGGDWFNWILELLAFLVSALKFLLQALVSILTSAWKLAKSILTGELFWYIMDWYNYLSVYLWSTGATILMGLFGLSFLMLIFSFVMRLLKGKVNNHNTLISYKKLPK